ncbi:uncharacterized protein EI97DRAFT_61278 [Westerdykella ornata]|uniref:F-box domain-containing protein n=1 Tax=Westerdykella ornata TaxID=318751 RepID=A0A6A6JHA5_WESOR|nr:uncharacterized protein EI97DRAFT_61278 [Westerdykella ornata]KAF2275941.1 hypothetical protein EI97DRAFT_61278 [Westerdykella ornata]
MRSKMATLLQLPREIVFQVLGAVADVDIRALFTVRRTCQLLHLVATHIITKDMHRRHGIAIHRFLQSHFLPIMDSSKAGANDQPAYQDGSRPFYSLPWASDPEIRLRYLRREATWRQIPLVSSSGHLIKRMQTVHQTCPHWDDVISDLAGADVTFYIWDEEGAAHYFFPQGIPLGFYYDNLLGYFLDLLKGGWKLLPGMRVDTDAFLELQERLGRTTNTEVMRTFMKDTQFAVLLFLGTPNNGSSEKRKEAWRPTQLGDDWNSVLTFSAQRNFTKEQSEIWAVKQWE